MNGATHQVAAGKASTAREPAPSGDLKPQVVAYKRARILEEASELFFQRGYEAATLDMLAERLSVTKPFLYTYFRNKSDILSAVCEQGVRDSLEALDRAEATEGNSRDRLRNALTEVARIIVERQQYLVVYQRETMNLEQADARRIMRRRHEFDLRVSELVADCRKDGLVTVADATAMAMWMGGLLSWIPSCYRPGSSRPKDVVIEQAVHGCMRLIGLD